MVNLDGVLFGVPRSGNWTTNGETFSVRPVSLRTIKDGMSKTMRFAAVLALASRMACRRLPGPESLLFLTVSVEAKHARGGLMSQGS